MLPRSSVLCAVLGATACVATGVAQVYTSYNVVGSPQTPGYYHGNTYAVDLNNDGIPDLVVNEASSGGSNGGSLTPYFAVFLANGDGTFKSPILVQYSAIPPGDTGPGPVPMAFGDFNGDGNMDIAMVTG